jgi:hypothetical protein
MGRRRVKPKRALWMTVADQDTPHPTAHHYHAKVAALMKDMPPGVASIRVAHDDWCGVYQGKRCNCDPEVGLEWTLGAHTQN